VVVCALLSAYLVLLAMGKPWFWAFQIRQYQKSDRTNPPKEGGIVFTGSSSIRFWHTLHEDMHPLPVINRGFGGSQISEVIHFAPEIIFPYKPKAVVLYCGDNDLAWPWSKSPEQVAADFQDFVRVVHAQLPTTRIYYISMKPSLRRWNNWPREQAANRLIQDFIATTEGVEYIDIDPVMFDAQGKLRAELFRWDGPAYERERI